MLRDAVLFVVFCPAFSKNLSFGAKPLPALQNGSLCHVPAPRRTWVCGFYLFFKPEFHGRELAFIPCLQRLQIIYAALRIFGVYKGRFPITTPIKKVRFSFQTEKAF
jgi:hypothetical protein